MWSSTYVAMIRTDGQAASGSNFFGHCDVSLSSSSGRWAIQRRGKERGEKKKKEEYHQIWPAWCCGSVVASTDSTVGWT